MAAEFLKRRSIHKDGDTDEKKENDGMNDTDEEDESCSRSLSSSPNQQNLYPALDKDELKAAIAQQSDLREKRTIKEEIIMKNFAYKREMVYEKFQDDSIKWYLILAMCFFILCAGAFATYFFISNQSTAIEKKCTVDSIMIELKQNFASQLDLSMKVINASLRPVISEIANPPRPAVIVLISSKTSSEVTKCLAQELARSLKNGSSDYVSIKGKEYSKMNSDAGKEDIDKKLSNHFNKEELNVGVISELDEIPAGAAMIFHGYCDDTAAQFRKAVYVMTATTKESIPKDARFKDMDRIVLNRLREVWSKDLHDDQLASLLTRLTPSAAVVLPEDKYPCQ